MSQPKWNSNQFNARNQSDSAWTNFALVTAPPGPTKAVFMTDLDIYAGATGATFKILDGSGGTVLWQSVMAANAQSPHITFKVPIRTSSGNGLYLTSTGASVGAFVAVGGFTAEHSF